MATKLLGLRLSGSHAPRVNLLPASIGERRLVVRQRSVCGLAALAILATVVVWYLAGMHQVTSAQHAADAQEAKASTLQAQKTALQPWSDLAARVAALEAVRSSVYASEIRYSSVLQRVAVLVPPNARLTTLTMTSVDPSKPTGAATAAAAPGAPGSGSPIASTTLTGTASGFLDLGKLMRAIQQVPARNGQPVFMNPFFTQAQTQVATGQAATVQYTASFDLGAGALSGRFQAGPGHTAGS